MISKKKLAINLFIVTFTIFWQVAKAEIVLDTRSNPKNRNSTDIHKIAMNGYLPVKVVARSHETCEVVIRISIRANSYKESNKILNKVINIAEYSKDVYYIETNENYTDEYLDRGKNLYIKTIRKHVVFNKYLKRMAKFRLNLKNNSNNNNVKISVELIS
ncbi:MAG: hypothetical protein HRT87_01435 [Legionellales bacterium]|nr:hypothetical protein [Legionellales bacterium]